MGTSPTYFDWLNQLGPQAYLNSPPPPAPGTAGGFDPNGLQTGFSYQPQWDQSDPAYAMRQNRAFEGVWGQNIDQQLADQSNYAAALQSYYMPLMNQAAGNLAANPGYTPDELNSITRYGNYQGGMTTPDQYAAMNPTDAQTAAMTGNPSGIMDYYNPDLSRSIDTSSAGAQRDIYGNAVGNIQGQLQNSANAQNALLQGQATQLQQPFLNSLISAYGQHAGDINSAIGSATGAVNAATSSPKLNLNINPNSYLMSDQDVQNIVASAGQDVQSAGQSRMDAYRRAAAASGNSDPMALAALDFQSSRQADEGAANAMTNASIGARSQQAQRAMSLAQAQLGAGQYQSGLQTSAQENLLGQNIGAQQNLLNTQLNAANTYEGMQLGLTAQQIAALQQQTAAGAGYGQWAANTGIGMEQGIGAQQAGTQQFLTNTGINTATTVDQLQAQRAQQLYQQQLQNQMYQQQNTFNQNTAVQDRQSAAYQAAANARMQGQNNYLNWASGQYGQSVGQGQTAYQQRIGAAGTAFPAMNTSTGQWGQYALTANQAGFGQNFMEAFGNSLGKFVGNPTNWLSPGSSGSGGGH